jgi:hypothetical protein
MKWFYLVLFYVVFPFLIHAQSVVLQGFEKNNIHVLEWVVTECSYISHFDIERSTDDHRFEVIYTKVIGSYDCNGNYSQTISDLPKAYKYEYRIKAYLNTALPIVSGTTVLFYQPENIEINNFVFNAGTIQMSIISRQKNLLTISITDIVGRTYYKDIFQVQSGKQHIQLPINILSTGIYFIHITDKENHLVYHNKYLLKNN